MTMGKQGYQEYIKRFDGYLKKYIPSKDAWTPVDDALYTPLDLFRIPFHGMVLGSRGTPDDHPNYPCFSLPSL